jgi:hypothetical protein
VLNHIRRQPNGTSDSRHGRYVGAAAAESYLRGRPWPGQPACTDAQTIDALTWVVVVSIYVMTNRLRNYR